MSVSQSVHESLKRLQWKGVKKHLSNLDLLKRRESLVEILEELTRLGYLTIRRENIADEKRRDGFLNSLRIEIETLDDRKLFTALEKSITDSLVIESLYRELFKQLNDHVLNQMRSEDLVSSSIALMTKEMSDFISKSVHYGKGKKRVDVFGFKVKVGNDAEINPDHMIHAASLSLGNTLKMLAYKNNWFSKHKIELPGLESANESHLQLAGQARDLGAIWARVENSESAKRFFGGEILEEEFLIPESDNQNGKVTSITFPIEVEQEFQVANERLMSRLFRMYSNVVGKDEVRLRINRELPAMTAPNEFISMEEAHDWVVLSELIFQPIEESTVSIGGLLLRDWLRGYAVLRKKAREHVSHTKKGSQPFVITESAMLSSFQAHGMNRNDAEAFLNNACFGKESVDLFDAPLVRMRGGKLYFASYATAHLLGARATLSQCARLNQHFEDKGLALEQAVLKCFLKYDLPASSFKHQSGNEEIQIDCLALWDDILFVIECKNNALPNESVQSKYYFLQKQKEAAKQVLRQVDFVKRHPNKIKETLAVSKGWKSVIPIVLNGMPFSRAGINQGVHFYDFSALTRFFNEETVRISSHSLVVGKNAEFVGKELRLWKGDKPVAADLVAQLEDPIQVKAIAANYKSGLIHIPISQGRVLMTQDVDRDESAFDNIMKILAKRRSDS